MTDPMPLIRQAARDLQHADAGTRPQVRTRWRGPGRTICRLRQWETLCRVELLLAGAGWGAGFWRELAALMGERRRGGQ